MAARFEHENAAELVELGFCLRSLLQECTCKWWDAVPDNPCWLSCCVHFDAGYRPDGAWGFEGLWDFHVVGMGMGMGMSELGRDFEIYVCLDVMICSAMRTGTDLIWTVPRRRKAGPRI